MKELHLVCNAHIDPVWLWTWPEGLAETLSTFRTAARFCREQDGFVFCHNEALLYQWVEEYDPSLFREIRKLVKAGKWTIIGGWYLQPDCNLPAAESFVRQILVGKRYFAEKFGTGPTSAVNFDSFGHSRGLVQILKKSGYDSYLFCRPDPAHLKLPSDDFTWEGFDGSSIVAHRSAEHYNSERGKAADKLDRWLADHASATTGLFLWGIGNHGGGPSREDLDKIQLRITADGRLDADDGWSIRHSWPEAFFASLQRRDEHLPVVESDLNPWAVGCYTSMSRVKRMHRELEGDYLLTEQMVTHAHLLGRMKYPAAALKEALEGQLFCEFHDILPGSGIPEVESFALRRMSRSLDILSGLKTRAFFALLEGLEPAKPEEFPVVVYNPEPVPVTEILEVELQGPEPNFNPDVFLLPELMDSTGTAVEYQLEKESSNIENDHRKRLVFKAMLNPFSVNRFSCHLREVSILEKPDNPVQDELSFVNDSCEIRINPDTGLIDRYRVDGVDYLKTGAARLAVMRDDADPWGMKVNAFRDCLGHFQLMPPSETARLAATNGPVEPVRIIESGPVRVVVEALFRYNGSAAVIRYLIPRTGTGMDLDIRIFWNERDRMLKLLFPVALDDASCFGQVAGGVQEFIRQDEELIAHQWVGLFSRSADHAFTLANRSTYGFDQSDGEIRLSLLRSPAYAGHPVNDTTPIVRQDRFTPRMDQGEHPFRFRLQAGSQTERWSRVDRESRLLNRSLPALCVYPSKRYVNQNGWLQLSDPAVRLEAFKWAEEGKHLIVRLFETTGVPVRTDICLPLLNIQNLLIFRPFEIKTLAIDPVSGHMEEVNLLEK